MVQPSKINPPAVSLFDDPQKDQIFREHLRDVANKVNRKLAACSFSATGGTIVYDGVPFNTSIAFSATGVYNVVINNRAVIGTQYQVLGSSTHLFTVTNKTNDGFTINTYTTAGAAANATNVDFSVWEY